MLAKWSTYYSAPPPWDTTRPASQLVAYLAHCPAQRAGRPPASPVELPPQPDPSAAPPLHACSACEHLRPPRGAAVLELGCGMGASLCFLARALGARVVGVDLVPAAVTAARQAAARAGVSDQAAFVQADVFDLPPGFDFAEARRMVQQQERAEEAGSSHTAPAEASASCPGAQGAGFDFVYDCQFAHTLLLGDRSAELVALLGRLLKPGGLLFMLTGHAGEPEVGPAVLSEAQLRAAFRQGEGWEWVWLVPTRFDPTPHYVEVLGKRPLAWWALLRRVDRH